MKIALVDTLFSWPPHGGAEVDLYHVAEALQQAGYDVHLFASQVTPARERRGFDPATLPFPATHLVFPEDGFRPPDLTERFREAVDAWRPDAVILAFAFFFKPHLIDALAHYPLASRYYAYEMLCPRDFRLFKDGALCPNDYFSTPNLCRPCTLQALGAEIRSGNMLSWCRDYVHARAYLPRYHKHLRESLTRCKTLIVSNEMTRRRLEPFHHNIRVLPGGVDLAKFPATQEGADPKPGRMIIGMSGRAEDPAKGLAVLLEAGERLARTRDDFLITATLPDPVSTAAWFAPTAWKPGAVSDLYQSADICAVPSVWAEPFGLVAVEAMACERPVCASRVGGLADIVLDGETGLLVPPGDAAALADALNRLLDDPALRRRMGEAGRRRVETEYTWPRVIQRHYVPLLEELAR